MRWDKYLIDVCSKAHFSRLSFNPNELNLRKIFQNLKFGMVRGADQDVIEEDGDVGLKVGQLRRDKILENRWSTSDSKI